MAKYPLLPWTGLAALLGSSLMAGCYGGLLPTGASADTAADASGGGERPDGDEPGDGDDPSGVQSDSEKRLPRLSHRQYENAVHDLLDLEQRLDLEGLLIDDPLGGRFANNQGVLEVTPKLWADYQRAAEAVADHLVAESERVAAVVPTGFWDLLTLEDQAAAFVDAFLPRAFRRPPTAAQRERFIALFSAAPSEYDDEPAIAGIHLVVQAALQSPWFLYMPQASATVDPETGRIPLDSWELASKLAFSLWNTMPDDELFALARSGRLTEPDVFAEQVQRMLDDPRGRQTVADVHAHIFGAYDYASVSKDPELFPDFTDATAAAMERELAAFTEHVVFTAQAGVRELLTAPYTVANPELARIYGVDHPTGEGFERVDLDPATRAGVLTQIGFLAKNAHASEVDSIHRGVLVNRRILCVDLPPPPPDVPPFEGGSAPTNRERIELHTGRGTCGQGCHSELINPVGFAFESYDPIGAFRTEDNGHPVDDTGSFWFADHLPTEFDGAVEFVNIAVESQRPHECYARWWLEYLNGRALGDADEAKRDRLATASYETDLPIRELIERIVTDETFTSRDPRDDEGLS